MTEEHLTRTLPSRFVLAVTVGGVIGLGILRGPGEIAEVVTKPSLYLALWLFAGLFVLLTTAVSAELVGMTPRSGGFYSLIRRAYGPYPGFVIGWADWLTYAADLALKAVVITEFVAILFPESAAWSTPLAITITSIFAVIQLRGIGLGAFIQESATALIGLLIIGLSLALFLCGGAREPASPTRRPRITHSVAGAWWSRRSFSPTTAGCMHPTSAARSGVAPVTVARSCIKGMVIVIVLYMLLNLALVKSVGLASLAGSDLALAHALELAVHPAAGTFIVAAAILILLSHQNLDIHEWTAYSSGACGGRFCGAATRRDVGKGGNPVFAVSCLPGLYQSVLFSLGGFEFLLLLSVFFFVPLYLALIVGILILRKREPDAKRPYRAWGHPYSTIVCLIGWTIVTLFQAYVERETALYAVAMVAVSWPVYQHLARK